MARARAVKTSRTRAGATSTLPQSRWGPRNVMLTRRPSRKAGAGFAKKKNTAAASAVPAAAAATPSAPDTEKGPQELAHHGKTLFYVGLIREHMKAWRRHESFETVTWATKTIRDPTKSKHQPVDAAWEGGFKCEIKNFTCGEYDSTKETDDSTVKMKSVWETWP